MNLFKKMASILAAVALTASLAACGSAPAADAHTSPSDKAQENAFPAFTGTDFEGNPVDNTLFSGNEVTLLNFWSNGCTACVNGMPELEKLSEKLREKGAELIGVNVEAGESEEGLSEAKRILEKQGATYRNLCITSGEAKAYVNSIFAFPTTILVDKNGNRIGEPITGGIEEEKKMEAILKLVDDVKSGKPISDSVIPEETMDDETLALYDEYNNIFAEHQELWNKVFENVQKDNPMQEESSTYAEFLMLQVENCKDLFTEEEQQTLKNDLERIDEIDKAIQALEEKD